MSAVIKSKLRLRAGNLEALPIRSLVKLLGIVPDTEDRDYLLHDARQAYRLKIALVHPDVPGGSEAECRQLNKIMDLIEHRLGGKIAAVPKGWFMQKESSPRAARLPEGKTIWDLGMLPPAPSLSFRRHRPAPESEVSRSICCVVCAETYDVPPRRSLSLKNLSCSKPACRREIRIISNRKWRTNQTALLQAA